MNTSNLLLNEKPRVLIAEDNVTNMLLVKCIFENILPDATISEAVNGLDAIEQYKSNLPDIVFMDIRMPVKNGYEATKEIRKLDLDKNTPIIALTAGSEGDKEQCLKAGMDDYIRKPIVQDSIEGAVRKWLTASSVPKEIHQQNYQEKDVVSTEIHYREVELRNRLNNNDNLINTILEKAKTGMHICLKELQMYWGKKNYISLMETAHKLKGMAMSACFDLLAKLASELEELNSSQEEEIYGKLTAINNEIMHLKTLIKSGI